MSDTQITIESELSTWVPKYIRQEVAIRSGTRLPAERFNELLNLLIDQGDDTVETVMRIKMYLDSIGAFSLDGGTLGAYVDGKITVATTEWNNQLTQSVNVLSSRITNLTNNTQSYIEQLSNNISLCVKDSELISKINMSAEGVKIESSHINLTGYVTVDSLKTPGTTVIDGGNITTGVLRSNNWFGSDGTTRTGEGSQIDLTTGKAIFSGKYNYAWLDEVEAVHSAYLSLQNGRLKVSDESDNQNLYFSHEGISTTVSGNNATGTIDFRSKAFGTSLDGSEYNGVNIRTNGSPCSLQAMRNQIIISPNVVQAIRNGLVPNVFDKFTFGMKRRWGYLANGEVDYDNRVGSGDGMLYWGTRTIVDGAWTYTSALRFSSNDSNRYLMAEDGSGNLINMKAKNLQAVQGGTLTLDSDGRVIAIKEKLEDGSFVETSVTYDANGRIKTVNGAEWKWVS